MTFGSCKIFSSYYHLFLICYLYLFDDHSLKHLSSQKSLSLSNNTIALGNVLYTDFALLFQISGIILLVAMIGAIILTLRKRPGVKSQIIKNQIDIKKSDVIEIVSMKSEDR